MTRRTLVRCLRATAPLILVLAGCRSSPGTRAEPAGRPASLPAAPAPAPPPAFPAAAAALPARGARVIPWTDAGTLVVERKAGTARVVLGSLRAEVTGDRVVFAEHRFAYPILAAVQAERGWLFLSADGAVAGADTFLGPLVPLGEVPRDSWPPDPMRVLFPGAGRLAVPTNTPDARLWTTDGRGPLAPAPGAPPGEIASAAFVDAAHGLIVLQVGELYRTRDGGASFTRVDLGDDAAAWVQPAGDRFTVATSSALLSLDRDGRRTSGVAATMPAPRWADPGLRARLRAAALRRYPELLAESAGGLFDGGRALVPVAGVLGALTPSPAAGELAPARQPDGCHARRWGSSFALLCRHGLFRVDPATLAAEELLAEPVEAARAFLSADGVNAAWECDLDRGPGYVSARSTCILSKHGAIRQRRIPGVVGMYGDSLVVARPRTAATVSIILLEPVTGAELRAIDVPLPAGAVRLEVERFGVSPDGSVVTGTASSARSPYHEVPREAWFVRVSLADGTVRSARLPAGAHRVGFASADAGVAAGLDLSTVWITRDGGQRWDPVRTAVDGALPTRPTDLGESWLPERRILCSGLRCMIDGLVVVSLAPDPRGPPEAVLASRLPVEALPERGRDSRDGLGCEKDGPERPAPVLERPDDYALDEHGRTRFQKPGADVELEVSGAHRTSWSLRWSGRDWRGAYQATARGTVPAALDGDDLYQLERATREGVFILRHPDRIWVPAGGKPVAIRDDSLAPDGSGDVIDVLSLPDRRLALLVSFNVRDGGGDFLRLIVVDDRGRVVARRSLHWPWPHERRAAGVALRGGELGVQWMDRGPHGSQWFVPLDPARPRRRLEPLDLAKLSLCRAGTVSRETSILIPDSRASLPDPASVSRVWRVYLAGGDDGCLQGVELKAYDWTETQPDTLFVSVSQQGELRAVHYRGNIYQSGYQDYVCTTRPPPVAVTPAPRPPPVAATAPPPAGKPPAGRWVRENPIPTGAPIEGFAGYRRDDVWAFGRGTLLHYDGKAWSRAALELPPFASCCGMTVHAPDDVLATVHRRVISAGGDLGHERSESWTYYWNGKVWSLLRHDDGRSHRPAPPLKKPGRPADRVEAAELERLWKAGKPRRGVVPQRVGGGLRVGREIWAIGSSPRSLVHFDGRSWRVLANVTYGHLVALHARAADDVWATAIDPASWSASATPPPRAPDEAGHAVLHFDGSAWSREVAPGALGAVWAASRRDAWAIGRSGLVWRWNGSAWSTTALPAVVDWRSVWALAADDVWLAGCAGRMAHWNGRSLTLVATPVPAELHGVCPHLWGAAADDVWAVALWWILHWDGSRWSELKDVVPRGGSRLAAVWGASADDVWAVGTSAGTIHGPGGPMALHWDGRAWSPVPMPKIRMVQVGPGDQSLPVGLHGIWGLARDDVWAVGDRGVILHYDGVAWVQVDSGTTERLLAVSGAGNDVRVVGENGTMLRWVAAAAAGRRRSRDRGTRPAP